MLPEDILNAHKNIWKAPNAVTYRGSIPGIFPMTSKIISIYFTLGFLFISFFIYPGIRCFFFTFIFSSKYYPYPSKKSLS